MENNREKNLMKKELEEFISERDSDEISRALQNFRTSMTYFNCATLEIETKFRVLNEQFSLQHERNPIESIKTRVKSFPSIKDKLVRKNLPLTICAIEENLNDVAGVRVICGFIEDIYLLADCLIQQDDVKLLNVKDYIKNPKPNGYRSLHLIVEIPIFLCNEKKLVKVEVQLRTIAMESWANLEHKLRYKKALSVEVLAEIENELSECAKLSSSLDEKMQKIRNIIEGA